MGAGKVEIEYRISRIRQKYSQNENRVPRLQTAWGTDNEGGSSSMRHRRRAAVNKRGDGRWRRGWRAPLGVERPASTCHNEDQARKSDWIRSIGHVPHPHSPISVCSSRCRVFLPHVEECRRHQRTTSSITTKPSSPAVEEEYLHQQSLQVAAAADPQSLFLLAIVIENDDWKLTAMKHIKLTDGFFTMLSMQVCQWFSYECKII